MASNRAPVQLSPSLLSADFVRLADDVAMLESAGVEYLHVDVMDGRFVPNITIGPPVVTALRNCTDLPLDCHLMIEEPDRYVDAFADAGASILTVHVEADRHLYRTIDRIRDRGMKAGVTLNPATSLTMIEPILPYVDLVLLMSVEPGFGGQSFIPNLYNRARRLRSMLDEAGRSEVLIEVDGGVKLANIAKVYHAGVDIVVSGSGIFGTDNPAATVAAMRAACQAD